MVIFLPGVVLVYPGIPYSLFYDSSVCRVSIDSLRIRFSLSSDVGAGQEICDKWACKIGEFISRRWLDFNYSQYDPFVPQFDFSSYNALFKVGAFAYSYRIFNDVEGWSFALLLGRYDFREYKLCVPELVMDINPNKVPVQVLSLFFRFIGLPDSSVHLVRYDVAFDYALPRSDVRLFRSPRRSYRLFESRGAVTEYQGVRQSHGSLKLYDKSAEMGLEVPVTRLELTVDGDFPKSLSAIFPDIGVVGNEQLDFNFRSLPFPVQAVILHPDLVSLLDSFERHTKAKYLSLIRSYQPFSLVPSDFIPIDSWVHEALYKYLHPGEELCNLDVLPL